MINKISSTNPIFTGYKQNFTDEEFKKRLQSSLDWAKENVDHRKYLKTKKAMNKTLEKNAKGGFNILQTYKNIFKKPELEPVIELSLDDNELVGKVNYYHSNPVEVRTQMPKNFKGFFESLLTIAKARMKEENIKTKLWHLNTQEKTLYALQNQRYQELSSNETQTLNPIFLAFDGKNVELTEKLIRLVKEKESLLVSLDSVKAKLQNKHYKLKLK